MHPTRRIVVLAAKLLVAAVVLVAVALTSLLVIGIPRPGSFTTEHVPRIGLRHAVHVMQAFDTLTPGARLIGFEGQGRLIIERTPGGAVALDDDGTANPLGYSIPTPAFGTDVVKVPGHDGVYLYLSTRNPEEDQDLLRYDAASGSMDTILEGESTVTSFALSPDGAFVLAYNETPEAEAGRLVRLALDEPGEPVELATLPGHAAIQEVDSRHVYVLQSSTEKDGRFYRVDLETGQADLVFSDEEERPRHHGTHVTWYLRNRRYLQVSDGGTAYVVRTGGDPSRLSSELAALWEVDQSSGRVEQVSPEVAGDVGHIALSADERFVVYLLFDRELATLMAFDRRSRETIVLHADRDEPVDWISNNTPFLVRPQRNAIVYQSLSTSGTRLREVAIETGLQLRLDPAADAPGEPRYTLATFSYAPPDPGVAASEGTRGFLYLPGSAPPEGEKHPVIIDFHGGPDFMVGPHMISVSSIFLDRGFAVVIPNYRGSTGSGVSFEQSDDGLRRPRQLEDAKLLVDWIRSRPELDADRIVLLGASWGGTMVLTSLIEYPELFLGGISLAPATLDPSPDDRAKLIRGWWRVEVGDERDPELRGMLESISPVTQGQRVTRPLLLVQGARDARLPVSSARKVRDAVARGGHPAWYLEASDMGHGLQPGGPLEGLYLFGTILEFVDRLVPR